MNYIEITQEELLTQIDNKSKVIITMGKRLSAISKEIWDFDWFLISALNRTVNINKAYTTLMRDSNFIAAAPLLRINIGTLLRLYASMISEYDRNTFAKKVLFEKVHIRNMKQKGTKISLRDKTLHEQLSKIEGMEWVSQIYEAGSSFVHFESAHFLSSRLIANEQEQIMLMTIGFNDACISKDQKFGSAVWMNKIIDSIVEQANIWMYEKAQKVGFDFEKLNEIK